MFSRPSQADASLARLDYSDKLESAVNEQINIEYNLSYLYHSMFAYFDRDNVGMTVRVRLPPLLLCRFSAIAVADQ